MHGLCPAKTDGTIFAIKRYALHDGPDLRTTVFLKGCPLSCWWCHNPEGLRHAVDMVTVGDRCVGCGECLDTCPEQALRMTAAGPLRDGAKCRVCGVCTDTCPALAHEATGAGMQVDEVLDAIEKDRPFYEGSSGGVTFSGGEPLSQPGFLLELLRECGRRELHRTVDTCGFVETALLLYVARETDLFLYDLKHMDSAEHARVTGVPNERILENLASLCRHGHAVQVRMPLIPGINDSEANLQSTGTFVASLPGIGSIDLLPYHGSAVAKYAKLGMEYRGATIPKSNPQDVERAARTLERHGLTVRIGG